MKNEKYIDLSHEIEHGTITYEGLPGPIISDFLSREDSKQFYEGDTSFHIGRIEMVANTGTYIDSPFHRFENGKDLSELDLSSIADLDGIVFHADSTKREIDSELFGEKDLKNKAVLIHTGWSRYWGTDEYFRNHPFLTKDAAEYLKNSAVCLVGIDSYNIDDTADGTRPAHTILLGADIPVVEHMCNLDLLPDWGFKFFAVPVKVKRFGTFPVRAFAII